MNAPIDYRDEEANIDLRAVLARLRERIWWVVASVVVFTGIFIAAALLITPVYRSTTVLVPAGSERNGLSGSLGSAMGGLGGLAALAGVNLGGDNSATEEALAVLKSRQFTENFIRDKNLLPKLFAKRWDAATGKWKVPPAKQPTLAKGYKYFDSKVRTIGRDKKSGLVTLQIDWTDRNEAAQWANELIQRLNAEMRSRSIANVDASVLFLEKELRSTTVFETREAINRLIEAQIKQRMLANVTQEFAFRAADTALPADADDPVKPRTIQMVAAGILLGLTLGMLAIYFAVRLESGGRPEERSGEPR